MSALSIETGTLLQLAAMGAAGAALWSALREQQTEIKGTLKQLGDAALRLEKRADRDTSRITKVETRLTKLETMLQIQPHPHQHDTEPPPSDEDERG